MNTKDGSDYQEYVRARNEATHETRKARKLFERKLAREVKGNVKVFCNYVNSRRKTRSSMADLKKEDGTFATEDRDKAEVLSQQYSSVYHSVILLPHSAPLCNT